MRIIFTLILLILANTALADDHWTEEVVLTDGPTIHVSRSVGYACSGTTFSEMFNKYPCLYSLSFEHPKLALTVRWQGIKNINPVAVQVIDDVPYLAIFSGSGYSPMHDKPELYGCPEVPFSFLKYDLKRETWSPIAPLEAPEALLNSNLVARYGSNHEMTGKVTKERVAELIKYQALNGYLQARIPRNAGEWAYKGKNSFLTSRVENDCRRPLERVVDAIFPVTEHGKSLDLERVNPKLVDYEIVEDKHFVPPLSIPDAERHTLWFDKETAERCNSYFVKPDQYDQRLITFKGFANDPTGKKLTWNGLAPLYCGNDYSYAVKHLDNEYIVLAKYTKSGDVLRYLKLLKPKMTLGVLARQSKIEDGYLYFAFSSAAPWREGFRGIEFTRWLTVRVKDE